MAQRKVKNKKKELKGHKTVKKGRGFFNKLIDKIPIELHLPSYQYCGPGTKLEQRLARGDKGINGLDVACKEHDIAYATHQNSAERNIADKKLGSEAIKRVFSKDAKLGERAASLLVASMMKAKTGLAKVGLGISKLNCKKKPKKIKMTSKEMSFNALVKDARNGIIKSKSVTIDSAIKAAIRSAKKSAKGKRVKVPRILKVPKYTGGILPIVPILAGLSAIGSIVGSVAGVVKTAKDIKIAQKQLEENVRHNKAMEVKVGKGLYLKPDSRGNGLYLQPSPKNF